MQEVFLRLGRVKSVLIITLSAVVASVIFTSAVFLLIGEPMPPVNMVLSIVAPGLIASLWSWRTIGMVIKIHELEEEMRRLAHYDALTSVMSRRAFLETSEKLYHLMRRNGAPLSVVYLDVDDFKKVNDVYGHAVGDAVLRSMGRVLRSAKRKSDVVGRLGGEEFAFTLPETDRESAVVLAERVRALIKDDGVDAHDAVLRYAVSVGIATLPPDDDVGLEALIARADHALYRAKESGKDRVVRFEEPAATSATETQKHERQTAPAFPASATLKD